jgi:dTDP-glucose pyrophosphorylase
MQRLQLYHTQDLDPLVVQTGSLLSNAMDVMNSNGQRLVYVCGADRHLIGILTDSDIRRFLSKRPMLNALVEDVCNTMPKYVFTPERSEHEARTTLMQAGIDHIPVVDNGRLVASFYLAPARKERPTVLIMAGGLGTRLRPLTDNCPKPMLKLAGKPILSHIIGHLKAYGFADFIISLNYLGDQIVNYYGDGDEMDVRIRYVREGKRLGTGGAIGLLPQDLTYPLVVINGDIITDLDMDALLAAHALTGADATMVVRKYSVEVPYGVVRHDDRHRYIGSEEKPVLDFSINTGIYCLAHAATTGIPKNTFFNLPSIFEDDVDNKLFKHVFHHDGRWIDIGTNVQWNAAQDLFGQGNG